MNISELATLIHDIPDLENAVITQNNRGEVVIETGLVPSILDGELEEIDD